MLKRQDWTWVVEGRTITDTVEAKKFRVLEFTVDPSKDPKIIDSTITVGAGKGRTQKGIYKINGDSLTVCYDPTGGKRPSAFASKRGSLVYIYVLKRQK